MKYKLDPLWLVIIVMPLLSIAAALLTVILTSDPPPVVSLPTGTPTPVESALVGQPAPNFELVQLDGEGTTRLSSLRGRVVFVNFWATWCEPCRRELPAFEAFAEQHTGSSAPIILALNIGETAETINNFLDEIDVDNLNVLLDSSFSVNAAYNVSFYPSTFVINPAGEIVDFHLGEITLENLNDYIAEHSA